GHHFLLLWCACHFQYGDHQVGVEIGPVFVSPWSICPGLCHLGVLFDHIVIDEQTELSKGKQGEISVFLFTGSFPKSCENWYRLITLLQVFGGFRSIYILIVFQVGLKRFKVISFGDYGRIIGWWLPGTLTRQPG